MLAITEQLSEAYWPPGKISIPLVLVAFWAFMSNIPTNAEHSEYHLAWGVMLYDGSEYMP